MLRRSILLAQRRLAAAVICGALAGCHFSFSFDTDGPVELLEITRQPQSTTVTAGESAHFVVGVDGEGIITVEWHRNGIAIPDANGFAYTTPPTLVTDDGTLFTVRVCNAAGCVTSLPALLTVLRGQ